MRAFRLPKVACEISVSPLSNTIELEVDSTHNRNIGLNLANFKISPEVHKSPRLFRPVDGRDAPVGCLCAWNNGNGFDNNLEALKTLAEAN